MAESSSSKTPDEATGQDSGGTESMLPLVYQELRRLAAAKLAREEPGQTLQPTALVHEAWLRLGGDTSTVWKNRNHFFACAATAMRRILVDNARRKRTIRRGGGVHKISADLTGFDVATTAADDELVELDDALDALAVHDARKAELIKYRYFVGLSMSDAAEMLGISVRTAERDWIYARAWLLKEIQRQRR